MFSLLLLFSFSIIALLLCLCSLFLFLKNTSQRNFLYSAIFFLCSSIAIYSTHNVEQAFLPQQSIIWYKAIYSALFTYILIFPLFISSLTKRPIARSVKIILFMIATISVCVTIFTDRIITNQTFIYGNALHPLKGDLYPLFLAILLVIPGYFYVRLLFDLMRHREQNRYLSLAFGIAIGFAFSLLDVVGVFRGTPLIPWLRSPYVVGVLIVSLSFAWTFLAQYSWIFITLTKSQHEIERLVAKSNRDFVEFVHLIAKTLDAKDKYTAGHSLRVMDHAVKIAHALQLPDNEIDLLKQACLLHDIGKISIPDGILNKAKRLTPKEREYILKHPVVGKKILSTVSEFKDILDIIYAHHERIDGKGYPDGRMRNDIPFLARILAVADTYDAMRSERPYRPARDEDEAIEELILAKGSQLDAEVVDIFIEAISKA